MSSNWTDSEMTDAQVQYAACDAYVSVCLFNEINKTPLPLPLSPMTPVGSSVVILNDSNSKIVARGSVYLSVTGDILDNINITPTRIVITVCEILVPGTIMGQHQKRALKSFGQVPFNLICHQSHIRVVEHDATPLPNWSLSSPVLQVNQHSDPIASETVTAESSSSPPGSSNADDNIISLGDLLRQCELDSEPVQLQQRQSAGADLGNEEVTALLGLRNLPLEEFSRLVRSRVLKDAFHLLDMVYISRVHGLRIPFAQAFRDALFIPNIEDKACIETWLRTKNLEWEDMLRYKSAWLWRHCRRTIPPPEVLYPLVYDVLHTWGPLKDAKTGLPLFNSSAWQTAKNILELVRNGYVSDPPGVTLYYCVGLDAAANGLPIYRCVRGTNMTEGGVHTHLRSRLPTSGVSIRHMRACLLDFILRHNLLVSTYVSSIFPDYLSSIRLEPTTRLERSTAGMTQFGSSTRFKNSRSHFLSASPRRSQQILLGLMVIYISRPLKRWELCVYQRLRVSTPVCSRSMQLLTTNRNRVISHGCRARVKQYYHSIQFLNGSSSASSCEAVLISHQQQETFIQKQSRSGIDVLMIIRMYSIRSVL